MSVRYTVAEAREAIAARRDPARPGARRELDILARPAEGTSLRRRLKVRRCEICSQDEQWQGKWMSLILDHINGDARDNRLENLRMVCPNCTSTLDTHCGRRARVPKEDRDCKRCGRTFQPKTARQAYCSRECGQRWDREGVPKLGQREVRERPPYDHLVAEVATTSWSGVGRKYGVSDNAVRKWVRGYEEAAWRSIRGL